MFEMNKRLLEMNKRLLEMNKRLLCFKLGLPSFKKYALLITNLTPASLHSPYKSQHRQGRR
jgi:hypothetical protein